MVDTTGIYIVLTTIPPSVLNAIEYEDLEHIFFLCLRFNNENKHLEVILRRPLQVETFIPQMIESQ